MLFYLLRGGLSGPELVFHLIEMFIAIMLTFAFHEFMHAAAAVWLGDNTPKSMGRLTLNPLAHVDPMGAFLILLIGFGWGRPVIVNPSGFKRFKNRRLMSVMVAFAGPLGNFLMALLGTVVEMVILCTVGPDPNAFVYVIYGISQYLVAFSLGLMAFNLLPICPLDGFNILDELLPLKFKYNSEPYRKYVEMGPKILFILIIVGRLGGMDILGTIMGFISLPAEFVLGMVIVLIRHLFGA